MLSQKGRCPWLFCLPKRRIGVAQISSLPGHGGQVKSMDKDSSVCVGRGQINLFLEICKVRMVMTKKWGNLETD